MENDLSSLNESFEDITLEDSNPSCSTPRRSLAFKHDLTPTSKAKGQPAHKTVRIGPSDLKREMLQCCMEMDNEIVELLYVLGVGEEFKKSLVTRQIAQLFPNSSKTRIRRDGRKMYPQITSLAYYSKKHVLNKAVFIFT
ncbi:uncharacterized protein LOC144650459 [Oculina patagonica]